MASKSRYFYFAQKKYDKAEDMYLKAIQKGNMKEAMYNLGNLYTEQKKYDKAEKMYLKAIQNGHIGALNNLGNLYFA